MAQNEDIPIIASFGFKETENLRVCTTFDETGISVELLRSIFSYGWEKPSPIQQRAITPLMEGKDVIAQAQSGTGKTGAFTIGSVSMVEQTLEKPQLMILSPVRDLAIQTYQLVKNLTSRMHLRVSLCIGSGSGPSSSNSCHGDGETKNTDVAKSDSVDLSAHIIVGTPGRVWDCLRRGKLNSANMKTLILDEADEMLSKGFKDQIRSIFHYLPREIQVGLFSATIPEDILELSNVFMRDPVRILVKKEMLTLEGIHQYYIFLESDDWKYDVLKDIYASIIIAQTIIFCNSKQRVIELQKRLETDHFSVDILHGGMEQNDRNKVMNRFRAGDSRILLSTDIISRGIDIQQINLIINYDLPFRPESYLHRIGRSGRYGRKGIALNFVTQEDYQNMRIIEKFYQTQIETMPTDFMSYIK